MSKLALVDVARVEPEDVECHGVSARELLELRGNRDAMSAAALDRWLVESGFAELSGEPGRLSPTACALEVAEGLDLLG
jgi:hypothetical protein